MEQISPELVLVDPALAAHERPREFAARVIARRVVPLGMPLVPQETPAGRPMWLVVAIGLCLLTSGFLVSLLLFSGPSAASNRPATVVPAAAGASPELLGRRR
ncbi:MAG TPA: hypothetical protein VGH82_02860 [Gaiellaceae bacterium]